MAKSIEFDNRLTIGNLLTIGSLVVTFIAAIIAFKYNDESQSARLAAIEQNQHILEQRIALVERELDKKQTAIDKIQMDVERTVTYMELLLDKERIPYVK